MYSPGPQSRKFRSTVRPPLLALPRWGGGPCIRSETSAACFPLHSAEGRWIPHIGETRCSRPVLRRVPEAGCLVVGYTTRDLGSGLCYAGVYPKASRFGERNRDWIAFPGVALGYLPRRPLARRPFSLHFSPLGCALLEVRFLIMRADTRIRPGDVQQWLKHPSGQRAELSR